MYFNKKKVCYNRKIRVNRIFHWFFNGFGGEASKLIKPRSAKKNKLRHRVQLWCETFVFFSDESRFRFCGYVNSLKFGANRTNTGNRDDGIYNCKNLRSESTSSAVLKVIGPLCLFLRKRKSRKRIDTFNLSNCREKVRPLI